MVLRRARRSSCSWSLIAGGAAASSATGCRCCPARRRRSWTAVKPALAADAARDRHPAEAPPSGSSTRCCILRRRMDGQRRQRARLSVRIRSGEPRRARPSLRPGQTDRRNVRARRPTPGPTARGRSTEIAPGPERSRASRCASRSAGERHESARRPSVVRRSASPANRCEAVKIGDPSVPAAAGDRDSAAIERSAVPPPRRRYSERDRPLHPPRDGRPLDRCGAHGGLAARRGRGLRGDGRADRGRARSDPRGHVHRRGGAGARTRHRSRRRCVRRRAQRLGR